MQTSDWLLCCVQYLDTMADIVKQGIVKAVEDLEKENQEKLMQEVLQRLSKLFMLLKLKIRQLLFTGRSQLTFQVL